MTAVARGHHRRRGFNHLSTISSTLQNLGGAGALANELIQNADDAVGARNLTFRFTPEALEVIDDGGFEACEDVDADRCPWESRRRKKRRCDFHAFQELAGASKQNDPELTGAFGVGFLAVYQVTDRPELISSGQHWIIDESQPEEKRIWACGGGCAQPHQLTGTRFVLPWASQASDMRTSLGAEPVPPGRQATLHAEVLSAVPKAMIFLRKLESITVERGPLTTTFRRDASGDGVQITGPKLNQEWLILETSFESAADELRADYEKIGERHAVVRIAVLPGAQVAGRLYATLPTQFATGMPLHIDASFFPRIDRKGILLDTSPARDWNLAAIDAAAKLLGEELELLARRLQPRPFWRLIRDSFQSHGRRHHGTGDSLAIFWHEVHGALADAKVMWTMGSQWAAVSDTVLPSRAHPPETVALLEALGIPTVSPDIQRLVGDLGLAVPTAKLDAHRLLAACEFSGLAADQLAVAGLPAGLGDRRRRGALRRLLAALVAPDPTAVNLRIRKLALWRSLTGRYASLQSSWLVDRDTIDVFGSRISETAVDREAQRNQAPYASALLDMGDVWGLDQAVELLEASKGTWPTDRISAAAVLGWLASRQESMSAANLKTLRRLPLIHTSGTLRPAEECVIPGGFADPLDVAGEVDGDIVTAYRPLLEGLGVAPLSFADYVRRFVPDAVAAGLTEAQLLRLLDVFVDQRRTIDRDASVREVLEKTAWVPCRDRHRCRPGSVYFDTGPVRLVLGDDAALVASPVTEGSGAADLLTHLGARTTPQPADVVARIRALVADPPAEPTLTALVAILHFLQAERADMSRGGPYDELLRLPWLPRAEGSWTAPSSLFFTRQRSLFASTGAFIALRPKDQEELRPVLGDLGVRQAPTVELVVGHLENLVDGGHVPEASLVEWLNQRSNDGATAALREVRWLATTDNRLVAPAEVFIEEHELAPHLPVLHPSMRPFMALLRALEVRPRPEAPDATRLLVELAAAHGTEVVPRDLSKTISACWRLLGANEDADLGPLIGWPVVLGSDRRLYRADQILLNDNPEVARQFSETARGRLIRQPDIWPALARAGVGELSKQLGSHVVERGAKVDGTRISVRILDRQRQLARIVGKEAGGRWQDVLTLARDLTVQAFEWVTVEYFIEGFEELGTTEPLEVGAHDLGEAQLVVAAPGGRADWFEIAQCLKEILSPDSSPAVTSPIRDVLAEDDAHRADWLLTKLRYPELDDGVWDEFEQVLEERRARAAEAEAPESDAWPEWEADTEHPPTDEGASADDEDELEEEGGEVAAETVGSTRAESGHEGSTQAAPAASADAAGAATHGKAPENNGGAEGTGGSTATRHGVPARARDGHSRAPGQRPPGQRSGDTASPTHATARYGDGAGAGPSKGGGSRALSYVEPSADRTPPSRKHDQRQRDATGEAGVDLVVAHLKRRHQSDGCRVEKMRDGNRGFDVQVLDLDGTVRALVEVKAKAGDWGGVGVWLSPAQHDTAIDHGVSFILAVVERVYDAEATLYFISNPARRIDRYCFDQGWKGAAHDKATVPGAMPREPSSADDNGYGAASALSRGAIAAGFPEPEANFKLGAGIIALAAWPDLSVGILAPGAILSPGLVGWALRAVEDWTPGELLDSLRQGG